MITNTTIELSRRFAQERHQTLLKEAKSWRLLKTLNNEHPSWWVQIEQVVTRLPLYSALFENRSFPGEIWLKNSGFQINRGIVEAMAHGWLPAKPSKQDIAPASSGD